MKDCTQQNRRKQSICEQTQCTNVHWQSLFELQTTESAHETDFWNAVLFLVKHCIDREFESDIQAIHVKQILMARINAFKSMKGNSIVQIFLLIWQSSHSGSFLPSVSFIWSRAQNLKRYKPGLTCWHTWQYDTANILNV